MLIKGALSGLRQFLANESPLKMMKNSYFTNAIKKCVTFLKSSILTLFFEKKDIILVYFFKSN